MTDPSHNVIEIGDEKDEARQPTPSLSASSAFQPTKFNPKTFPFLASMLRKMSGTTKLEPARIQATTVSAEATVAATEGSAVDLIKPIEVAAVQEVQQITRNLLPQKLFEVVEDFAGIALSVYSGQNSHPSSSKSMQLQEHQPSTEFSAVLGKTHLQQKETRGIQGEKTRAVLGEEWKKVTNFEASLPAPIGNYEGYLVVSQNLGANQINAEVIEARVAQPMFTESAATAEKNQNISELIFQFSQKIVQYNQNEARTFENTAMEQEGDKKPQAALSTQMQIENPSEVYELPAQDLPFTFDLPKVQKQANEMQSLSVCLQLANISYFQSHQQPSDVKNYPQPCETKAQEPPPNQQILPQEIVFQPGCEASQTLCAISHQILEYAHIEPQCQAHQNPAEDQFELQSNHKMPDSTLFTIQPQQIFLNPQQCQTALKNPHYLQSENACQKTNQTPVPVLQKPAQLPNKPKNHPMPTMQQIKTTVVLSLPNFPVNWSEASDAQFLELYETIRQELRSTQITERIQNESLLPAQNLRQCAQKLKTGDSTQKQLTVDSTSDLVSLQTHTLLIDQKAMHSSNQPLTKGNPSTNEQPKQQPKQQPRQPTKKEDESEGITQLQQMKNLSQNELRKQICSMNPEWKEEISRMNHAELLSTLDLTIAQLKQALSTANNQQQQLQIKGEIYVENMAACQQGEIAGGNETRPNVVELESLAQQQIEQPISQVQQNQVQSSQTSQSHQTPQTFQSHQALQTCQPLQNQTSLLPQISLIPHIPQIPQIPHIPQAPKSSQLPQPLQIMAENYAFPSMSELRSIIISKVPDLQSKVNALSDNTLEEVYISHFQRPAIQLQEPKTAMSAPIVSTVEIPAQTQKPTVQYILSFCEEKFPQIVKDLKLLKEQQIREIYENLLLKMGPDPSPLKSKAKDSKQPSSNKKTSKDQKQQLSEKSAKSADKGDSGPKRTHEAMAATNVANAKKPQPPKAEKKKKLPPLEIRNILIAKLPQLKANIMMLDDNEIQRIFYESIENDSVQTTPSSKPDSKSVELKPAVAVPQKKAEVPASKPQIQPKPSVHILQTKDELQHKAMRTIILVHREMQEQGELISKASKSDSGLVKRCGCECCKKMDLNDLLLRIGDLLEERK